MLPLPRFTHAVYECSCGFTAATATAFYKHLAESKGEAVFHEAGWMDGSMLPLALLTPGLLRPTLAAPGPHDPLACSDLPLLQPAPMTPSPAQTTAC